MSHLLQHVLLRFPRKRLLVLMDCFDFPGRGSVVIPKLRNIAYFNATAFAHNELQRRSRITQCEERKQGSWKVLSAEQPLLSPADYGADSDLAAVLFMVDMTLGCDNVVPREQMGVTPPSTRVDVARVPPPPCLVHGQRSWTSRKRLVRRMSPAIGLNVQGCQITSIGR